MATPAKSCSAYPSSAPMAPPPYAPPPAYDTPPTKYVVIDGVRQINPDYKAFMKNQGKPATTALSPDVALTVVSNMDQHQQLRDASMKAGQGDVILAPSTDATIDILQEPEICGKIGLRPDQAVDALGNLFAKYEVPMGLMNKLMGLTEFEWLEFIIDDSGSMGSQVNSTQTRWTEARDRLKTMLEILAHIPTPTVVLTFLNRPEKIVLKRNGESPAEYLANAYKQIDAIFTKGPTGSTPIEACLTQSFLQGQGKKVARYLFCDGQPNGGDAAQARIAQMLKTRQNPKDNPITLMSCSENDQDVAWMKEVEEVAPYCGECDDFRTEAEEVRRDQGDVFPYTVGFYLLCQLVGAMNPDDLDALDESIPLTKWVLDNLLGITSSEQDYSRYFQGFIQAQLGRRVESPLDALKKQQNWGRLLNSFAVERSSNAIPEVRAYKEQLQKANPQDVVSPFNSLRI